MHTSVGVHVYMHLGYGPNAQGKGMDKNCSGINE